MLKHKKYGFTILETLTVLAMVGIIAALTIPHLSMGAKTKEYSAGLKKAIVALDGAITRELTMNNVDVRAFTSNEDLAVNLFKKHMNVLSSPVNMEVSNNDTYNNYCNKNASYIFATNDGMIFCFYYFSQSGFLTGDNKYYGHVLVDVNGQKKPNMASTTAKPNTDIYRLRIKARKVVPEDTPVEDILMNKYDK